MPHLLDSFTGAAVFAADKAATAAIDADLRGELGSASAGLTHREIMRRTKVLLAVAVSPSSSLFQDPAALASAGRHATALRDLQSPTGLFTGGDNMQSPPDSAFTINDVCDAVAFTADDSSAAVVAVRDRLAQIARAAAPALLVGGVHTPNHRWELSSALARLHRSFPDQRLVDRAAEWLAEGIDVDADGFYSERSPNYAVHVSNPSLLALSRILDRPAYRDIVEKNLEATLDLIRPDGSVETMQSRRQDQRSRFPLAQYLVSYRSLALSTGRGDFAWAAERARQLGGLDHTVLPELLLAPELAAELPESTAPASAHSSFRATVGLASRREGTVESVVYGGSDYSSHRVVRSGLASNPTFLRLFSGDAILDSVRLSRDFFDLGPFRADTLTATGRDRYRLDETITAAYYQPLPAASRDPQGVYALTDDGRFAASMAFADRPRDEVAMTTTIDATLRETGADLLFTIGSPATTWSIELAFRPGGVLEGVEQIDDAAWILTGTEGSYRVGSDRIVFGPGGSLPSAGTRLYRPGQDYTAVGGTDAASGVRVYITGTAPSAFGLHLEGETRRAL
jgi:hypothetical protein